MTRVYSTYEAKAKFTEILRRVRGGQRVLITYRGKRVAEMRPLVESERPSLEDRLRELREDGTLGPPGDPGAELRPLERKTGALRRFLESRE